MDNPVSECVLLCLSASPTNGCVIRAASKIAEAFAAEFKAIFIETPAFDAIGEQEKAQLESNKKLAEKCGASVASAYGSDVAVQIAEYAKVCGATKIVVGHSDEKKRAFAKTDIPQRLSQLIPELEIYSIPCYAPRALAQARRTRPAFSVRSFLIMLGLLCAATLLGLLLKRIGFTEANIITIYILSVLFIAFLTEGYFYGIAASVLSTLVFNYLFTEPRFSFMAYGTGYPVTFFVMFTAAFLTSSLTVRAKGDARSNAQKAHRTEVLFTASRNLQSAESRAEILEQTARQILRLTGRTVVLYPVDGGALERPMLLYPQGYAGESMDAVCERESEIARWVYAHNEQAGASTETRPDAQFWYLAVRGRDSVHAVAGVCVQPGKSISESERSFFLALLGECGVALEKQKLREAKVNLALEAQREKMRSNLLRAISHDLRTPLTSISGNAELLLKDGGAFNEKQKLQLYGSIYEDSTWLINLVENLLSITRMDNETLALDLKPELIAELIDEAVAHTARRAQRHRLRVVPVDELLMVKADASLIIQVLVNLIDNAVKYTPPGSSIVLSADKRGDAVTVRVADDGPGIPEEAKARLFEMFYTGSKVSGDARRGFGLGLALCRSIVAAHGGEIGVDGNAPHGAVFFFTLPGQEDVDV
ncbi:MAG: DUF4118 domain-containing protein [Oscillospiraceae bacterium]|nr:DUF4118 domain-containing protein [Oscillospiraceae bacterium]